MVIERVIQIVSAGIGLGAALSALTLNSIPAALVAIAAGIFFNRR